MHRLGDGPPAGDLFGGMDAGGARVAVAFRQIGEASVMIRPAEARCV
jgi:hypothetical protein